MTIPRWSCALALLSTLGLPVGSPAQEPAAMTTRNTAEMEFVTFPGMPTCATGSVQKGDHVDAQGNEISPEVALTAVGEVPGVPATR